VFSVAVGVRGANEAQFRRDLSARRAALPNVYSTGEARRVPLSGGLPSVPVSILGAGLAPRPARYNIVSPGYFDVMSLRAVTGRTFSNADLAAQAPVVVVSDSTARSFWPGDSPLGKRLMIDGEREVIGVVPDVRSSTVWRRDQTMVYLPPSANGATQMYVLVQMSGEGNAAEVIRRVSREIAGNAEVVVRPIDDAVEYQLAPFKAVATAAAVLGTLALVMASIGIYGVISYLVAQRTREFGIRLAMGATRANLLTLVMRSGLRLAAAGLVVGLACGLTAAQLIAAVLTDVSRFDPVAFLGVAVVLFCVAFVACVIPASRAANMDPLRSLQSE
jgi:ABC-type antimicrobial peptide transport system permease subunit